MHRLILIIISILFFNPVKGQDVVSVTYHSTLNTLQLQIIALQIGLTDGVEFNHNVDVLIMEYTTTGSDMLLDTASGLLLMPVGFTGQLPVAFYQHGTTGREDVPSTPGQAYQGAGLLATFGVATLMPDYLGLGSSRGFHPYVHSKTEATASVDMLRATEKYLAEQGQSTNGQILLSGYSQGGHAAMALHKYIQEEIPDEYTVTASVPMSGPYSISGVMRDLAYGDQEYIYPSFIVYAARGAREIDPSLYENEGQIFEPEFLGPIQTFVNSGERVLSFNLDLIDIHFRQYLELVPSNMFIDSVLQEFRTNEDHPFNMALRENDLYDWTPQAPVLMLYCPADDQVPFRNSIIADSVMNARGALSVEARDVSGGSNLDHVQCAVPAIRTGIPWLLSFIQTTPTIEIGVASDVNLYPNPSSNRIIISALERIDQLVIASISGATYYLEDLGNTVEVDVARWPAGMYAVQIFSENTLITKTLVVQR